MRRNTLQRAVRALVVATLLALGAVAPRAVAATDIGPLSALPDSVRDYPGFGSRIYREGRVFVAGQPDSTALAALPAHGIACVVNLRRPSEMANRERVPFDEEALLADLGVEYVTIPLGGDDHPYTTAAVDTFAAVLERHDGPVLLHCTSGWRAAHLWTAYLVRHQDMAFADALRRGEAIAIDPSPLDGLLGRRTELRLVEP